MPEGFTSLAQTISTAVLEMETNDFRFESFCNAVVSGLEGEAVIFSTSRSWDLGRDGIGGGRAAGIYVCTSLRDDVDDKSLADIERITSTTSGITRLYFCSSHRLSEHRRQSIENVLANETDYVFPIVCLGATQLTEADCARDSAQLEKHYGAEINNALRAIERGPSDETETRGLRLALIASSADDSAAIRHDVYASGLLEVLSDGKSRTLNALARDFSAALRLQRNVAQEALQPTLSQLYRDGLIDRHGVAYTVTTAGLDRVKEREQDAAIRLLNGRQAIRETLESSIGARFLDDHFNVIWGVFEERMAQYFHSRGDALVSEISELLGTSSQVSQPESPLTFLDEFAEAVAATSVHEQQRDELKQAVKDMFTDRTSAATDWLVRLSASFLAACAAGLEYTSNAALARLFERTTLALDTDVLLSLLGNGEPEHHAVSTIVNRWTRLGGKVLAPEPVLEEVAYHAHIAPRDYEEVRHRLPGTADERIHLIENAFVRSFAELLAENKAKPSQWRTYLGQYKGATPHDFGPVLASISTEYSIGKLPPRSTQEADLERDVRLFLSAKAEERYSGDALRNAKDKARRDAEMYSALVHHLKILKSADPGATCLLVSSARRLLFVDERFQSSGELRLVISIAALLQLISMLPDVSLGLTAMKAFLFDERRRGFSSELERVLVRLVRSSEEYSMPWAKRTVLMRSVRDHLVKDAHESGERQLSNGDIARIEREALMPTNVPRTAALLRDAMASIAIESRAEREAAQLRAKVKELEAQLAQREAPTSASKKQGVKKR